MPPLSKYTRFIAMSRLSVAFVLVQDGSRLVLLAEELIASYPNVAALPIAIAKNSSFRATETGPKGLLPVELAAKSGAPAEVVEMLLIAHPGGFSAMSSSRVSRFSNRHNNLARVLYRWTSGVPQRQLLLAAYQRLLVAAGTMHPRLGKGSVLRLIPEIEFVEVGIVACLPRLAEEVVLERMVEP